MHIETHIHIFVMGKEGNRMMTKRLENLQTFDYMTSLNMLKRPILYTLKHLKRKKDGN